MALLGAITTWSAGDKLTATALNNEFLNLLDALNGSDADNIKIEYTAADLPTLQLGNTHGSGYALQAGDGTSDDLFGVKSTGVIESKVTTGTAPLIVASTTLISNLNADLLDGVEAAALPKLASANTFTGTNTFSAAVTHNNDVTCNTNNLFLVTSALDLEDSTLIVSNTTGNGNLRIRTDTDDIQFASLTGGPIAYHDFFSVRKGTDVVTYGNSFEHVFEGTLTLDANNGATLITLTDAGGGASWSTDSGSFAKITLTANSTLNNLIGVEVGGTYSLIVIQDGTGGWTLSFGTNFKFSGGVAPTITTTANAVDVLTILARDANTLYVTAVQNML
jgi:hypothetical protein